MSKQGQYQYWWLAVIVIVSAGLIGCNQDTSSKFTTPGNTVQEIADTHNPALAGNFFARQSGSDEIGAYVGRGEFVVQVPAGDYLLEYTTDLGRFYLVLRASASSLLYIGLQAGDTVQDAIIYTGTITDTSGETQEHRNVTLFVWPGSARTWQEVFRMG